MVRSDTVSSRLEWCFLRASYFASRGVMKRAVPRDFPGCSNPVLSAVKPWFSQGFSHIWPVPLAFCAYPCTCMPAGAAPVEIIVLCAALPPGESSSESPESSQNPRFSTESMWFCSGGAGFELGKFESYWYSMLEQRCRACSHRLSIQDD
jgi:hypothetical protein